MTICKKITVEPALFFFMLATYTQYPIFQDMVYQKICMTNFNESICDNLRDKQNLAALDTVQKKSSYWIFGSTISIFLPTMLSSLYLGSWSDKISRKLAMLLPPVGGILSNLVYIFMSAFENAHISLLILGSFTLGFFGSYVSFLMSVNSYLAHVTNTNVRVSRISSLEAMTFLGGAIGPFLTGYLKQKTTHTYIFLLLLCCNLLVILYITAFVKEVINEKLEKVSLKKTFFSYLNLSHVKQAASVCFKERAGNKRTSILLLLLSIFIVFFCNSGESDVSYLFAKDKPREWEYTLYSYYAGTKYAVGTLTLLLGVPFLKHLNCSDDLVILLALVSKIAGLVLLSLSTTTTSMFLVPLIGLCSSWCSPCLRAMLSKLVETDESDVEDPTKPEVT